MRATNVADSLLGKPRWVIDPEDLDAFKRLRAAGPPPQPPKRKRLPVVKNFYD